MTIQTYAKLRGDWNRLDRFRLIVYLLAIVLFGMIASVIMAISLDELNAQCQSKYGQEARLLNPRRALCVTSDGYVKPVY